MKILALIDHYLPGTQGGGQLRSLRNLVDRFPEGHQFLVVTRNRDHASTEPYPGLPTGAWVDVGRARVLYLGPGDETASRLAAVARESGANLVHASSLFSRMTIRWLLARRLGMAPPIPLVVAPRGECSAGALGIRGPRKRAFLRASRVAGLHRGVVWQASTERERDEIRAAMPWIPAADVQIAPDVPGTFPEVPSTRAPKQAGLARLVFVSRLARMKNLAFALRALRKVSGQVTLDVHGTLDDPPYWDECRAEAARLPAHVVMHYRGALQPDEVPAAFAAHDFSVLPTLGENFGHVVFESLSARCPVVLSDRTAWPDLGRAGAGFTVALEDQEGWTAALQACVDMGPQKHAAMSDTARTLALDFVGQLGAVRRNVEMFEATFPASARPSGSRSPYSSG